MENRFLKKLHDLLSLLLTTLKAKFLKTLLEYNKK